MKQKQPKGEHLWRESWKMNKRVLKLFYKNNPQMILSQIFYAMWTALTPYVGIYLSALLIGEIAGGRNRERLIQLVFVTLVSAAVISLGTALLKKWQDTESAGLVYSVNQIFAGKMLDMDFVSVDSTKTHELLGTIKQNQNGGGWGLYKVLEDVMQFVSALLTLLGGALLSASLFIKPVPESAGGLVILNNPIFLLIVVGVMLAVTYISPALANKADSYWALNSADHNMANRLFTFWKMLGQKKEVAMDMRVYRQDLLCGKYMEDKEGAFCSKGMFAHLARGAMGFYWAGSSAVSVVFVGVVYVFVCLKAWAGAFGVGAVTQYVGAITKLSGSLSALIRAAGSMKNNVPFLQQIFNFFDIPNAMHSGTKAIEVDENKDFEIEFKDVSFKYPGSDNYVLKHVNMKFNSGTRMAIVGQNGSGKSTFIKLLCRLYDPTEGEILLNGKNIQEYDYDEYMDVFSVVFQDFKLFAFPLGQNVAAKTEYDRELVEECLKKAGFGVRYDKMEKGLGTYLYKNIDKEGVDVSGGEAQKIALARTLYKAAPIIILDEPTAALDPIAESEVYSNFNNIVGEKTAIYISHRLSSCRFCNDIAVFHNGELVQRGNHEQLVKDADGKYYELWNAQAQYYAA